MNQIKRSVLAAAAIVALCGFQRTVAQQPAKTWSQDEGVRIMTEVQKKLTRLDHYGVFDWLTFGIQGKTVVLKGYASRPLLKDEASQSVKGIAGVESVDNQIEVLPLSPSDDRIRASAYNRIYTNSALSRYNANQGSLARALGPGGRRSELMAGGITNDPPLGYHAIHVIVKNGHLILFGLVSNETDAAIAGMMANGTPGAFSVDNDIIAEHSKLAMK